MARLGWARGVAALAWLALAAPAAAADLVVWIHYQHEERAAFERVVAAYNAAQGAAAPRVTVTWIPFDGFADKVTGAVPRGRGPDLFIYPQDRLGAWADAGLIEPLEERVAPGVRDRFVPTAVQAVSYHGALYALPVSYKLVALFHVRSRVPVAPATTAELAATAARLTDRAAGRYGLVYPYTDYWFHAALQNGFGGRAFDPLLHPTVDSAENVRALALLVRWKEAFLPPEPTREEAEALFNQGKAAMLVTGPWFLAKASPGLDLGVAQLPRISEAGGEPMRPWMTVEGLYVSARSAQKPAAYAFAQYATDVEAARTMAVEGRQVPASRHVQADPALAVDPRQRAFFLQERVAVAMPNGPEMTALWGPATTALGAAVRGSATPAAALARAQAAVGMRMAALRPR